MAALMAMAYSYSSTTLRPIPPTSSSNKSRGLLTPNYNHKFPAGNIKPAAAARGFPAVFHPASSKRCICKASASNGRVLNDKDLPDLLLNEEIATDGQDYPGHKPHNTFPRHFVFGAASAAFQVEGATKEGGRGPSIWDTFCQKYPGKIADGSGGEPAAGSYYRYKEDVKLLADIGLKAYRFSISWSRVLPKGRGEPNEDGIRYYNNLIDELQKNGIEAYVTLFHWDVPQALEDEYGGFLSRRIVEDYKNYVDLCFNKFGDRVKHWITMNEPYMFSTLGYCYGIHAPGHCTPDLKVGDSEFICPVGDSIREPYKVAHNILLAHSEAAQLYKDKYKDKFGGKVGITLVSHWFEPYDNQPSNIEAHLRALDFMLGWFLDPLKFGNYPFSMRALVGERLPTFTPEESAKLKDSFDFIGLNYYTSRYARDKSSSRYTDKINTCDDDMHVDILVAKENVPIGPAEPNSWVNVYPKGIKKLLLHIKNRYSNPPVYITENGVLEYNKSKKLREEETVKLPAPMEDIFRSEYHTSHLHELEDALSSRADVRGYFVWSLMDSFEWNDGYTCRFGLNHIDYKNLDKPNLTRYPKQSAVWLSRFLKNINHHGKEQPETPPPKATTLPIIPQPIEILLQ